MYNVDISHAANYILEEYTFRCARDNGEECALRLLDAYDEKISYLETAPLIGCGRLRYVPSKYRILNFWPHLWFVFQVKEDEKCVKIEYIIDDRQNYGVFLK
jgi:hypothetical protein